MIYVGTGEETAGTGMYKSSDGGKTWTDAGLKDTRFITAIIVDPRDPNIVIASARDYWTAGPGRIIVERLGEKPFHVRGPLNTSVLDAVFCTILENLNRIPRDLPQRFKTLLQDKNFEQATYYSTSDVTVVETRFTHAGTILIGS